MYAFCDKCIKDMNRRNLAAFNKLKQLKFDELNVFSAVSDTYAASIRLAKKRYLQIAHEAYIAALLRAKISKARAEELSEDSITEDWILDMLEEYDPVTLYQFLPEAERKKQRTVEAIIASRDKGDAVDTSLRLWVLQTSHYAEKSVDEATIGGYKAAGIKKVKWVTAKDDRVCATCRERDGKIYPIGNIPPKPHYRCRCEFHPIKTTEES